MKQMWVFLITLTFLAVGCEKKDEPAEGATDTANVKMMAACPVCDQEMMEDAYCAGCNAVATTETELVHCDACDKDFEPGTYCAQCNRFILNAKVHCGNCRGMVIKGHYCTGVKLFKGLPDAAYGADDAKPYAQTQTCPDCRKQRAGTEM